MDTRQLPPFRPVLITSITLFGIGAVGLTLIFLLTLPTLGPRWLMFFFMPLVFSAIALPFAWLVNRRLSVRLPFTGPVLVREAVFFGMYIDLLIWLQFGKVLNFALAVFLFAGFAMVEILLRWRERSRFVAGSEE